MAHIHAQPGGHDVTVSAYILRRCPDGQMRVLLHMHKNLHRLMQPGGHIETDENPWAAMIHELREETGYDIGQLSVLQTGPRVRELSEAVLHPTPLMLTTHRYSALDHYHDDLSFAFVTNDLPAHRPVDGESQDVRWLTADEIGEVPVGQIFENCREFVLFLFANLDGFEIVSV